jgi:hypothetical protein
VNGVTLLQQLQLLGYPIALSGRPQGGVLLTVSTPACQVEVAGESLDAIAAVVTARIVAQTGAKPG